MDKASVNIIRYKSAELNSVNDNFQIIESLLRKDLFKLLNKLYEYDKHVVSRMICRWSIISNEMIDKYSADIDFFWLSGNTNIEFNQDLIKRYEKKWYYPSLSRNSKVTWDEKLIFNLKSKIDWWQLSLNSSIDFNVDLIEKYESNWRWGMPGLSKSIEHSWTPELIELFANKWEWIELSSNPYLPWTEDLIEKYSNRIHWDFFSRNNGVFWNKSILDRFQHKLNWSVLSSNPSLPWSDELIRQYMSNWNWKSLSANKGLNWSSSLVSQYITFWDFDSMSLNTGIPWIEVLNTIGRENFDEERLCRIGVIPWSEEKLDQYILSFEGNSSSYYFGGYPSLPWSKRLIKKYEDIFDWEILSKTKGIPWDLELLDIYFDKWNWTSLSSDFSVFECLFSEFEDESILELLQKFK